MKIRKATIEDLSQIDKLNRKFFHEIRDFRALLESKDDFLLVAQEENQIIGFTGLHLNKWNNTARIIDVFVRPDSRRRGHASALIKKLTSLAKSQKVRTLIAEAPSQNPVLAVYLKNGFRLCGFNDRYYSNAAKEIALFLSYDFNNK